MKEASRVFRVTVNEVLLAAISGAYRELLLARGERPAVDAVRSLVPVNIRDEDVHPTELARERQEMEAETMAETNEARTAARKRLEERRGFIPHLVMYFVVNAGLIFIWSTTGGDAFFWPVFPLLFWGGGLLVHAWSAYFSKPITEADVDREAERFDPPTDKPDRATRPEP